VYILLYVNQTKQMRFSMVYSTTNSKYNTETYPGKFKDDIQRLKPISSSGIYN